MNVLSALGDFDEPQRSSLTMFGVLTIAVRIYQDRWGYGIYSGPIGSAVFIITVKWVRGVLYYNYQNNHSVLSVPILWILPLFQLQKMKQLRAVYPEKTVYTQQVGPGCCFGALALMLRFYFEVIIKNKCHNLFIPTSLLVMEYICINQGHDPQCALLLSIQEWDYAYVHSFYHLSLAVSFILLLPKKNRYAETGQNAAKLTCFTLCCCVRYTYYN